MPDRADTAALDPPPRRRDPDQTRRDILAAAIAEFAENGLSGARVDTIAARMRTTVRMIYYYFGSKEGLYQVALEECYGSMRRAEAALDLEGLGPAEAIRRMVEFTFDYQEAHPELTRLVSIENIHRAHYMSQSQTIPALNAAAIERLSSVLRQGQRDGSFRRDATPIALHMLMVSVCVFRVGNRHTLECVVGQDPLHPALRQAQRSMAVDSVLGYLRLNAPVQPGVADLAG